MEKKENGSIKKRMEAKKENGSKKRKWKQKMEGN